MVWGSHSPPRRLRLESLECKQAPAASGWLCAVAHGCQVKPGEASGSWPDSEGREAAGPSWRAGCHPASGRPGSSDSGPLRHQPAHTSTLTVGPPLPAPAGAGGWGQEGPAGAEGHFFFPHLSGSFFSVSRLFTNVYTFLLDTTYQSKIRTQFLKKSYTKK